MSVRTYKWLENIAKLAQEQGNYLFYDGVIYNDPSWNFTPEKVSLTSGNVTIIFYQKGFDSAPLNELKTRLKVLKQIH